MVFFSFSVSIGVHPLVPLFLQRPFDYSQNKLSRSKLFTLNFLNFCQDFVFKSFKTEKLRASFCSGDHNAVGVTFGEEH